MAITDSTRKRLWARSHNACALCKRPLVAEGGPGFEAASIVGDEAHIVSAKPKGPRGSVPHDGDFDGYDNLILLCKVDHKRVDDLTDEFPAERLRQIKRDHEASPHPLREPTPPARLSRDIGSELVWKLLLSGRDVWNVVANAHAYLWSPLSDDMSDAATIGDEFLDVARDYLEISDTIEDAGMRATRDATRVLGEYLDRLTAHGIVVYGTRLPLQITGGIGPPMQCWEARLALVTFDSLVKLVEAQG